MKNLLLSAAVIAMALSACDTAPKYTIKGTIAEGETANVYLLKFNGRVADTLAQAQVVNGKFELTGSVEAAPVEAYLFAEGQRTGREMIVLENADYTATLNLNKPVESKVEGTANQSVLNQYAAIAKEAQKKLGELRQAYKTAYDAEDKAQMEEVQKQFEELSNSQKAQEAELAKANADSWAVAYHVASRFYEYNYDQLVELYNLLGENAKATEPGKKIGERVENLSKVAIGQVAPDFTLNTPEGKPLSMHSIKAKVKVIDFWASWCGPCRGENPNVVAMYAKYHPKGLEILSVSLDSDKEAWTKAIADDKLTWNHVSDLKGWSCEAGQLYCVNAIPHLIVLDENNVIVAKNLRGEDLVNKVAELLNN